ncbi:ApaG domain protein [Acidovorax sp. RAC01]|nr:ApaG domain protein [Acidovorax sp. RAC01]
MRTRSAATVTIRDMPKNQFDVQVVPEYLPDQSSPDTGVFSFAYTITITNAGDGPAQLISRHWVISDSHGHTEEVKGLGVVGHQPLLKPGESFQYTSGCRLRTASGTMHGTFHCVTEEGVPFAAPVALFVLEALSHGPSGKPITGRVLH